MSSHRRNRATVCKVLLIASLYCSGSILKGQSPEVRVPEKAPSPFASSFRKFTFTHAKAADVLKILQQLEPEQKDEGGLAVDERTNSFIFQLEDDQHARIFEELCTLVDAETPTPADTGQGVTIALPALGPQPLAFEFSIGIERGESIVSLKQRYNELEQQAHQLADKLKQSTSLNEAQRTELQLAVRKSFEARQALQRAELADLAQRMQAMQQSIDMRDTLADKVVERRVEDLLNPNLEWDAQQMSEQLLTGPNQGFVDARTTNWLERVDINGKAKGQSGEPLSISLPQFDSPQELLARVDECSNSGSYEDYVTLFNDEGVRDLAGSLLMSALQLTGHVDLAKNQGAEAPSGIDSGVATVSEVLTRWLRQSANPEQLKAMENGQSTMLNAIGGAVLDQSAMQEFLVSMRKSAEGIRDHRKFCIELMQAYEKLTTKPFVYFGKADQNTEWHVSQFGDRAIATLVDGSPQSTKITLQQANGTWRVSSLFSELGKGADQADKSNANAVTPSTPAMEMQQRLQGEWDVKVMGFSADVSDKRPYQAVVRGQLFLLQVMEDGKVIGTPPFKMIWPEADHPDVVDIVWDPNNNSDECFCPGRIACDGKSLQLAFRSEKVSGKCERPIEICSGEGVSYFECVRKQPTDSSPASVDSKANAKPSSTAGPKYSGHALSWWLDSFWDNATASPKTMENETQEYLASEAIRTLRELPECNPVIEAVLAKWFSSVEHEVNEIQVVRAAKCIVFAAGPRNQKAAVEYLFKVSTRLPKLNLEKLIELAGEETELYDLMKQLILTDELAIQFAERLTNGTSSDRSLVTYYLLMAGSMELVNDKDPKIVELNAWYQKHNELFFNAFEAASKDENEEVRWFAMVALAGRDPHHVSILATLTAAIESDSSTRVRSMAIDLLTRKDVKSVAKSQNIELAPILVKTLESDTSIDVRYSALGALMQMDAANELVHATLLEWARCKERLQVEYALTLILRNHETGDRPQSIDELIELLSDPEWGTTIEVKRNNYRWARQNAIAVLGQYAAHAHRALPTLEAELARNNKDTLSLTTEAIDSVRGYCPDRPIDQLQGQWEFVSINRPSSTTAFFDFPLHPGGVYPGMGREIRTASVELPASIINVSGTTLKLGDRDLAEISHHRQSDGFVMLLDPDGTKRHCNGRYEFKGGLSPEYREDAVPAPRTLTLEVCELQDEPDATQNTKQTYEFRAVKKQ